MSTDKIDPESIRIALSETHDFETILAGVNDEQNVVNAAYDKAAAIAKQKAAFKKNLEAVGLSAIDRATGMAGALVRTEKVTLQTITTITESVMGPIAELVKTIPYAGKIMGAGVDALSAITKFQITEMSKAYEEFIKLSDHGVLETFEDLRDVSSTTKLSFEDATAVFTKYSETLGYFGTGVANGTKRYQTIAASSVEISEEFQRIGLSAKDVADMQLSYIGQQARYGKLKSMTDEKIAENTKKYILQVDQITRFTGTNRKEIEKQLEEQSKDVQAVAGLDGLKKEATDEITMFVTTMSSIDPDTGRAFKQSIYSSGRVMNDGTKSLGAVLRHSGIDLVSFVNGIRSGAISAEEATTMYANASKKWMNDPQVKMLAKIKSDTTDNTRLLAGNIKMSNLVGKKLRDINAEIAKEQADAVSGKDPTSKALSDSVRNMYNVSNTMRLAAVSSIEATNRMQNFAESAESLTDSIYDAIRDQSQIPLNIRARKMAARESFEASQYTGGITAAETLKQRSQADLSSQEQFDQRAAGNARKKKHIANQKRIIDTQVQKIDDFNAKKDQAVATKKRYEKQYEAIEEADRIIRASDQPIDLWSRQVDPTKTTVNQPTTGGTGAGSGQGTPSGAGSTGNGVAGTSAPPPSKQQNNIVLKAMGGLEGGSNYDIAFGDKKGKDGIIVNTLYPSWSRKPVMTAAEWSGGKNLSDLTLKEVNDFQTYRKTLGNFAGLGKYGFMQSTLFGSWQGNKKLPGIVDQLGLDMNTKFDGNVQEQIAEYLLKGNLDQLTRFGMPTTPEWAYMSWYVGPAGARAIWNAIKNNNGSMTAAQAIIAAKLPDPSAANPDLVKYTAEQFPKVLEERMRKQGAYGGDAPQTTPKGKTGGIFSGPSTGYLVELHGEEAVIIPKNDGSESLQFDSMFSTSKKDRVAMTKIFAMLDEKVDTMLDIAGKDYRTQRSELRVKR